MHKGLVSVIIPNWNGIKTIGRCLESVFNQTYPEIEVIVADNNSQDNSVEFIEKNFPRVHLVKNKENKGFPGGNNSAFKVAKGEYYMMLNNDTEMDKYCIEKCLTSINQDERYGACATKFLLDKKRDTVDAAGIAVYKDGLSIGRGRMEKAVNYNKKEEVFFASDGACLYKKELIDDIGLYDEDFFCYAEETDMGWRAQLRGWRCIYEPEAVVYHCHSASTGTYSPFKAFLVERNRLWVAFKNFPLPIVFAGSFYTFYRYIFQSFGALSGKGAAGKFGEQFSKRQLILILLKVYWSFFITLPSTIGKRYEIQKRKLISNREIEEIFKRYSISARDIALKE